MTTDNTAHPAPTPAPVAVPEGEPDWLTRLPDQWEDEADQHTRDQEFGIAEGLRVAAEQLTRAIRENARPEPVVAPLPSEAAVMAAAAELMRDDPAAQEGTYGRDDYLAMADAALTAALPHLRLVPEDDEDTVRVIESVVQPAVADADEADHQQAIDDWATWPWNRCAARTERRQQCDRHKGHEGAHALEYGLDTPQWSTRWTR